MTELCACLGLEPELDPAVRSCVYKLADIPLVRLVCARSYSLALRTFALVLVLASGPAIPPARPVYA